MEQDKQEKFLTLESTEQHPSLYSVVWRGGPGRVPIELQGTWTKRNGLQAIQNYLDKK